jgi:nucleoside phosphorylase
MILDGFTGPIICFALQREAKPFLSGFDRITQIANTPFLSFFAEWKSSRIGIVILGIGNHATEKALTWLFERTKITELVIAGYSGALTSEFEIGDIVYIRDVVDETNQSWSTTLDLKVDPTFELPQKIHFGKRLVTTNRLVGEPTEKQQLHSRLSADVVDMESISAVRMCLERNIPIGVVRVVSDSVDTRLSPRLVSMISKGKPSLLQVLKTIVLAPRTIPQMIRMASSTNRASKNLGEVLHQWIVKKSLEKEELGS